MSFDENGNLENGAKSSVVKEQVKPKFKRKLKKVIEVILLSVVAACIFGFVARLIFIKSEGLANKLFGIEKESTDKSTSGKVEVVLSDFTMNGQPTTIPTPVVSTAPTEAPTPSPAEIDIKPDDVIEPENDGDHDADKITPVVGLVENNIRDDKINTTANGQQNGGDSDDNPTLTHALGFMPVVDPDSDSGITLNDYVSMMSELRVLTDDVKKGIVTVKAKTSTVNWMGDDMENVSETFGGFFADNGIDFLFVTYYDRVMNADSLSVVLCTGSEYKANLFERDTNYNIAVVAVPIRSIKDEDKEVLKKLVCSNAEDIYAGMPIIALGSPNGNSGSLEYGFVTGCDNQVYVVDGELSIFTTDISNAAESEGIIVNYSGEVIGIISRALDVPQRNYASSSVRISSVSELIVEMCNGRERPLVGIRAENIPEAALTELGKENGIYINDVVSGSPADEAGIRKGDIIMTINGEKVNSVAGFMENIMSGNDSDGAELVIYRGSKVSGPEMTVVLYPRGR